MRHIRLYENFSPDMEEFSYGTEHVLYQDPAHPDRLYKRIETKSLERFEDIVSLFQQHPHIFPRIYKRGADWINIEKLDTSQARREYELLADFLGEDDFLDEYNPDWEELDPKFADAPAEILQIWQRWRTLLTEYTQIYLAFKRDKEAAFLSMRIEDYAKLKDTTIAGNDIHGDQFGYSKTGRLKILDI